MVWARNLFNAKGHHPRLYRRSEQEISDRLPSLMLPPESKIQYPELLNLAGRLHSNETIDVILKDASTRYILFLVSRQDTMPNAESVVFGTSLFFLSLPMS